MRSDPLASQGLANPGDSRSEVQRMAGGGGVSPCEHTGKGAAPFQAADPPLAALSCAHKKGGNVALSVAGLPCEGFAAACRRAALLGVPGSPFRRLGWGEQGERLSGIF